MVLDVVTDGGLEGTLLLLVLFVVKEKELATLDTGAGGLSAIDSICRKLIAMGLVLSKLSTGNRYNSYFPAFMIAALKH